MEKLMSLKLATWNVALPVARQRRDALRTYIDHEQADVWVLTETHDGFILGHEFMHSSAPGRDGKYHKPEHRWVTIWSRWPPVPLVTSDEMRTAAARINPDFSPPVIAYGMVLPWTGSTWRSHPSAAGVAFQEALAVQANDWKRLRLDFPEDEFFILGDFNQDMVAAPPRYCGTRGNRVALEAALDAVGLVALTGANNDPIRRVAPPFACIDHICARADSKWRASPPVMWPKEPSHRRRLSDHFGLSVTLHMNEL